MAGARKINHPACLLNSGLYGGSCTGRSAISHGDRRRCEITGLRSTHSSVQSLDFEDCRLQEIEWAPLMSNGAFPDPIHTLKECSLKYNTFTEMNFNRFDFSDGNEIVGSMFAKWARFVVIVLEN